LFFNNLIGDAAACTLLDEDGLRFLLPLICPESSRIDKRELRQ
jgi:hypothetical protein